MQSRRKFVKNIALGTAGVTTLSSFSSKAEEKLTKITILHTNDMHSRIEPFPADDPKYPEMGGMAQRAEIVSRIRKEEKNVLLLDAGDVFQGTPYFNYYGGELEFKIMSMMKYDACTMGNHDFDNGLEGFLNAYPHANFPFLCANYDFSDTILKDKTTPYKLFKKSGIKIGVFGIRVELNGLVDKSNYGNTKYLDPIKTSNHYAKLLKEEKNCDLVICLSHLGYEYETNQVSDKLLAVNSRNIDLIIGGHTHTFLEKAVKVNNLDKKDVLINQTGWAGISLGKVDFYFSKKELINSGLESSISIEKNHAKS